MLDATKSIVIHCTEEIKLMNAKLDKICKKYGDLRQSVWKIGRKLESMDRVRSRMSERSDDQIIVRIPSSKLIEEKLDDNALEQLRSYFKLEIIKSEESWLQKMSNYIDKIKSNFDSFDTWIFDIQFEQENLIKRRYKDKREIKEMVDNQIETFLKEWKIIVKDFLKQEINEINDVKEKEEETKMVEALE